MSLVTDNISKYIKGKGINLSKMSRDTGIPYVALYDSLLNEFRNRELRADELYKVCGFLGVDPKEFAGNLLEHEGG